MARKKKKKKSKVKKSGKKSRKVKKSRKISRRRKKSKKSKKRKKSRTKARRINFKAPTYSKDSDGNSVIKVSDSWANHAYVNESKYKKNIRCPSRKMINFGLKREKELLG